MPGAKRNFRLAPWSWVAIAALAVLELVAAASIRAAVPSDDSWGRAAAFVRERHQPGDRIVAAPVWAEPIVREHLGDLLSLRVAAPPDETGIPRVWELSIRGASKRDQPSELDQRFDGVRVRMWTRSSNELVYDFVAEVAGAQVELVAGEQTRDCPTVNARPGRGGLGRGPMPPERRFVCDSSRPWLWVGATVLADLELRARRCVWQHPAGAEPVRVTYPEAVLGDRLILSAGIDYDAERERRHGPVRLRVFIEDQLAGELIHEDGDGWSSVVLDTSGFGARRAEVRFETTAEDPSARLFCWAASATRDPGPPAPSELSKTREPP